MKALMGWVEQGIAPEAMRVVKIDKKSGEIMKEGSVLPYQMEE
jgi:hypothetical protein